MHYLSHPHKCLQSLNMLFIYIDYGNICEDEKRQRVFLLSPLLQEPQGQYTWKLIENYQAFDEHQKRVSKQVSRSKWMPSEFFSWQKVTGMGLELCKAARMGCVLFACTCTYPCFCLGPLWKLLVWPLWPPPWKSFDWKSVVATIHQSRLIHRYKVQNII